METTPQSGQYRLGFRMDPLEKLKKVFQEVSSLHKLFSSNPIFGVEFTTEEKPPSLEQLRVTRTKDDVEIVGEDDTSDPLAVYYADGGNKSTDREPVYNDELGLAVEKLREGYNIERLWTCIHKV
jgi:Bardet-Biedl syndrome 5 protein